MRGRPPSNRPLRIAFYAPLKPAEHPVPSGDRRMARLLLQALRASGHEVRVASTHRSFAAVPEPSLLASVEEGARAEAARLSERWSTPGFARPDLWFTYHSHYKAPDFLGPTLASRFGLPYAIAEASHASKRAHGPWAAWHAANELAIRAASVHFCLTDVDRAGLSRVVDGADRLVSLPPFIDAAALPQARPRPLADDTVRLATVAMMRPGDKVRSYAFLARALACLPDDLAWQLGILGDGPERRAVEGFFAGFPPAKLAWRGELSGEAVAELLAASDIHLWPGFGEAYGMAYLEAAAAGLPSVALDRDGVSSVVIDGVTGRLVEGTGSPERYAEAILALARNPTRRQQLGRTARSFVRFERSVAGAAAILSAGLARAVARGRAAAA